MSKRVAVVTGSNRGIGLGIVRSLSKLFDGDVILTARDEKQGQAVIKTLEEEGISPKFHQLDISDHSSIVRLRDFLQKNYEGLDILVNNAGIMLKFDTNLSFEEKAERTLQVNYFANLDCCEVLFPILRPHARVCNISSMAANWAIKKCSPKLVAKLTNPDITIEELSGLMNQYIVSVKDGKYEEAGFPDDMYAFSKIGLTVMSYIHQRELDRRGADDIIVNACTPGYVSTDMTQHKGTLTIEEGIVTPLYCALLPPNIQSPRGQMIRDKEPVDWVNFVMVPIV
ncbi:unnamed protein product [Lymnaea stagnalis]|uniref:carbonyl reductase (NADPH) n=1 Tax=Lymnaea stagnalis TaxID=6523 RepID=A0AAV2I5M2_LYMST